ncbi:MAG TPA: DUF58 domain-containing protein [Longilinea sp.]|nr:DUF58 domain-containing protein [Longilinea sp.]
MIFSTVFGLLVIMLVVSLIFHLPLLIWISCAMLTITGVARWWQKNSLSHVTYQRRFHFRRGFPGETTTAKIMVANQKNLPLTWLRAIDPWPMSACPEDPDILVPFLGDQTILVNHFSLLRKEKITRTYPIRFIKRGVHTVGPAKLESGDLFGIYSSVKEMPGQEYLTVFPALLPSNELNINTEDPFGDRRTAHRLFEDPNQSMGIRPYQQGDSFRRVHWASTAKTGELQVRVYQPVSAKVLEVCMNVSSTETDWGNEVTTPKLERLASVAATFIYQTVQQGYSVGLMSNGFLAHSDQPFRIQPSRSPDHLGTLLSCLAAMTALTSAPFSRYLMRAVSKVPYGATLIVITPVVTQELAETLFALKRYRLHTTLVSLDKITPPRIPGIRTMHIPEGAHV